MAKKAEKVEEQNEEVQMETPAKAAEAPEQKKVSAEEFEKEVIKLAEKGLTAEKIGEELKKKNIHSKDYAKKISIILREKNLYQSPDVKNIQAIADKLRVHTEKNRQDKKSQRDYARILSHLRKIKSHNLA